MCEREGKSSGERGAYIGPMPRRPLSRNVLALSLVALLTDVSSEMIYPLIPTFLATVLGAGAMSVGAIEGAAESLAGFLKYFAGSWSDRVTRRKPIVVAGYALASVARPLVGLAQSVMGVFTVRMVDRIGKGIRTAPRDALIADSTAPEERGRAFGFHSGADHLGAVLGPLIAFLLLGSAGVSLRTVFLLAAIPAGLAMIALVVGVREDDRKPVKGAPTTEAIASAPPALGRRFYAYLGVLLIFTLGNSTDAFLLLRARDLGSATATIPLLWAALHVVKSVSSLAGGQLSDSLGRRPLIIAGWCVYALVYLGFARASVSWHGWALFLVYGLYFGLTEGVEKALVADLVPAAARGRAYGWYNLAIAAGALPASLLFGLVWEQYGGATAFTFGAVVAAVAAFALLAFVPVARVKE